MTWFQSYSLNFSTRILLRQAQNLVKPSSAVATNSPKSAFCGGFGNDDQISNEVIQFDGKNWASLPAMNVARCGAAAVFWNGMKKVLIS